MLLGCGRSAVEVDVQEVLDVALRWRAACTVGCRRGDRGGDGVVGGLAALLLDGSALDLVGAEAALTDERLGRFVVDRGEGGQLAEELL